MGNFHNLKSPNQQHPVTYGGGCRKNYFSNVHQNKKTEISDFTQNRKKRFQQTLLIILYYTVLLIHKFIQIVFFKNQKDLESDKGKHNFPIFDVWIFLESL